MSFKSQWLDWKPGSGLPGVETDDPKTESIVSTVSALDGNSIPTRDKRKKESSLFGGDARERGDNICVQGTDNTDNRHIQGPALLAGDWLVSHHIAPDGKRWTYLMRTDCRHEAAYQQDAVDDGHEHHYQVEHKTTRDGRRLKIVTRDDERAWEIHREPEDAA